MNMMRCMMVIIMMFILSGCTNEVIKPTKIETTTVNHDEAFVLLDSVWGSLMNFVEEKKQLGMLDNGITKSEFEFILKDQMSLRLQNLIFESIFEKSPSGEISIKKEMVIPSILDSEVQISKAYIKKESYSAEHDYLDKEVLIIVEEGKFRDDRKFSRRNIFIKNTEEKWILDVFEGDLNTYR